MLKREQAQERLEQEADQQWIEKRSASLPHLPSFGAWLRLHSATELADRGRAAREARRFEVSRLSMQDRGALFSSLFPNLTEELERAWQDLAHAPYDLRTWDRRPFRAAPESDLVAARREDWFSRVVGELAGHDPDAEWLAAWGGHLGGFGGINASCSLLSAAIDIGGSRGDAVLDILTQSASNTHEIGVMGSHVTNSLMQSESPRAWEFVEKLLISAQRQEGLRQSILESAHLAHPVAFKRMLRLIVDERLVRFASTVRAIDVWFSFMWDSASTGKAQSIVEAVVELLDDPKARAAAMSDKDSERVYLALWCEAYEDVQSATDAAVQLLRHPSPEKRWIGLHALHVFGQRKPIARIAELLGDPNMCVAARALDAIHGISSGGRGLSGLSDGNDALDAQRGNAAIFDRLESLLRRINGKEEKFKPLVFPWGRTSLKASELGYPLVEHCPLDRGERLIKVLDRLDAHARSMAVHVIVGRPHLYGFIRQDQTPPPAKPLSTLARSTLVGLLGDPAADVRTAAADGLATEPLSSAERDRHIELADRKASDICTRVMTRLLTQTDGDVLASASRLLSGKVAQIQAGLELLRAMVEANRAPDVARRMAGDARRAIKRPSKEMLATLDAIAQPRAAAIVTVKDAFGLVQHLPQRPLPPVRAFTILRPTSAAAECIWSLESLIHEHRTLPLKTDDGERSWLGEDGPPLLGTLRWMYLFEPRQTRSAEEDRRRCPVMAPLELWLKSRSSAAADDDGLELFRAWVMTWCALDNVHNRPGPLWPKELLDRTPQGVKGVPAYGRQIRLFLDWALRLSNLDTHTVCLDQLEAAVARGDISRVGERQHSDAISVFSEGLSASAWLRLWRGCPSNWTTSRDPVHLARLEGLLRSANRALANHSISLDEEKRQGLDEDSEPDEVFHCTLEEVLPLWERGVISDDELLVRLAVGELPSRYSPERDRRCHEFASLISARLPGKKSRHNPSIQLTPRLDAVIERLRVRVLEVELARASAPTEATPHAMAIDPSGGIDVVVPALAGLGKLKLVRSSIWNQRDKAASFSKLIRSSRPRSSDTPQEFAKAARAAGLSEERLVELALYQPRWAEHVEHAIGWKGVEEATLWLRAHTKTSDTAYSIEEEKESWEGRVAEITPIPPESLADGAVDRAWFRRAYGQLGPKRWGILYDAAKYASSGIGHTRARLFADAILGKTSEKELTSRIKVKRHQDAARALGLMAIKPGADGKKQVLGRFKTLQEMRRTSRKHGGSMLQASEKRAVEIGMENLAWTAGYPDPLRLQWAMEIEEFGDLAKGPVRVQVGPTTVELNVDEDGSPSLTASKQGKPLKSIPPAVRKDKRVVPLTEHQAELRRQKMRIRISLEQAMCRGDTFAGHELATLFGHPLLKSMLSRLVMVGVTKAGGTLIGYPDRGGKVLRGLDGANEPIRAGDSLRVAHPLDLLATKRWDKWQRDCFAAERVQPFKQVFREVYIPTESELQKPVGVWETSTNRYAGQQVQPRQALALFGARGWVARPEEGVQRTFHQERVTVHVSFQEGFFTPAEIDGLTLAGLSFAKAGATASLALKDVPRRLFSEVMRDLDLVVSVAHRGEVDPEASHSTVEMRSALLRGTCALLCMKNVRIEEPRAIIVGELGEYTVHLGSGTIHKMPGGTLWVVPVHSQHRGRVFLPFADDDPKTAEILSKVLLLARDREIKDPALLAQIRNR